MLAFEDSAGRVINAGQGLSHTSGFEFGVWAESIRVPVGSLEGVGELPVGANVRVSRARLYSTRQVSVASNSSLHGQIGLSKGGGEPQRGLQRLPGFSTSVPLGLDF